MRMHILSFHYNGDVLTTFHYFYGTIVVAPKAREGVLGGWKRPHSVTMK